MEPNIERPAKHAKRGEGEIKFGGVASFRSVQLLIAFVHNCLTLELPYAPYMVEMVMTLTWLGLACWVVCFWWMHRISARQDALLKELHEMTRRIEHFSQAEHDLIQEVHPQVGEIKEHVKNVAEAVGSEDAKDRR